MKYCSYSDRKRFERLRKKRTYKHKERANVHANHLSERSRYAQKSKDLRERVNKEDIKPIIAPKVFNLVENPNEMLSFFSQVKIQIKSDPIKIVMKDVTELSANALLYLIAIMQDARAKKSPFHVGGDLPEDPSCRRTLQASGFLNYVKNKNPTLQVTDNSILRITSSNKHEPVHIQRLCDFVIEKFKVNKIYTRSLFNAITELVQNTIGHAYPQKSVKDNWFFFAKYNDEYNFIDIAFLDTGVGIPNTVRKKFFEIIKNWINRDTDTELIFSALEGAFRTKTNLKTRGKGLPSVFEQHRKKVFLNFALLSNYGYIFDSKKQTLPAKFSGTLFSWRIQK
ncbi:MAG: hypothetical protein PHE93_06445 [Clostridia bacterium]|nr:hypothetical protein [Clostridia bacterium]